jgi:hypothetical protein
VPPASASSRLSQFPGGLLGPGLDLGPVAEVAFKATERQERGALRQTQLFPLEPAGERPMAPGPWDPEKLRDVERILAHLLDELAGRISDRAA